MNKQFQTFRGLDAACLWYCYAQEFAVAGGEFVPGVIKTSAAPDDGAVLGRVSWQRTSEIFRAKRLYHQRSGKTHRVQSLPLMEFQCHTSSRALNAAPNLLTNQTALSCSKMMTPIKPFILTGHFTFCVISRFAWCNIKMARTKSLLINPLRIKISFLYINRALLRPSSTTSPWAGMHKQSWCIFFFCWFQQEKNSWQTMSSIRESGFQKMRGYGIFFSFFFNQHAFRIHE